MKALILSGGKGTRLKPLTFTKAKQLVPLMNKPVLGYVLDQVSRITKEVGIVVSPEKKEDITAYVKDGGEWGVKVKYIIQDKPLGLAHAVKVAKDFLGNDDFIMYLGDNLIEQDISQYIKKFYKENLNALIFLKEVENPSQFGVAVLDKNGNVVSLVEKPKEPPSNLALVGVYVFDKSIHKAINKIRPSKRGELEITDAISYLIKNGYKVGSMILDGTWIDTGKKDDVLAANAFILDKYAKRKIEGTVENSIIDGRVIIEKGAKIKNSKIRGPAIIGKNSHVEDSFIGPYTSIGENCTIERSKIMYSIILNDVKIKDIKGIEESLIGEKSIIEKKDAFKSISLHIGDHSHIRI